MNEAVRRMRKRAEGWQRAGWEGGEQERCNAESEGWQKILGEGWRRYQVGKTIGEGNFAKVKFARSLATGDLVAVKVLSKRLVERDKLGPLIRREIKASL